MEKLMRRILHLFRSGSVLIGVEHFLVMFPSAILIAKLSNSSYGAVVELPTILLACGIGTLFFVCFGKIPFFLGPSFAYIGFVSYQVSQISNTQTLIEVRATIMWGYIIASIMLLVLCLLYQLQVTKRLIALLFPYTVMGPAISLIGLELASTAVEDAGFTENDNFSKLLAILTLIIIIISSLVRHHILQNASVLIGVLFGSIFAIITGRGQLPIWPDGSFLHIPSISFSPLLHFPSNILLLAISVIPSTIIAFAESLGRVAVYDGMMRRDKMNYNPVKISNKSLLFHSISNLGTSIIGITPNAIYAENLAIMNLHNSELSQKQNIVTEDDQFVNNCYSPYSIYPYIIASFLCILVACIRGLQSIFISIPMPVLGGMELFVFGLITAPGIQMLVEQQANYKKIANQIVTAAVLMAGISGVSFSVGTLTLQGMSLGLVIGVTVNLLAILLSITGHLNEKFSLTEVIEECLAQYPEEINLEISLQGIAGTDSNISASLSPIEWKEKIKSKEMGAMLNEAAIISFNSNPRRKKITIIQNDGNITLQININKKLKNRFKNDYTNIIMFSSNDGTTQIVINEYMSRLMLQRLLNEAQ